MRMCDFSSKDLIEGGSESTEIIAQYLRNQKKDMHYWYVNRLTEPKNRCFSHIELMDLSFLPYFKVPD